MGWFSLSREKGFPTHYDDQHSPARIDIVTAGLISAFVIVAISLLAILPSFKGGRRVALFFQISISMFIGAVCLLSNYGHEWEVGVIKMSSPYKPGSPDEIKGTLGLHVTLRGINITLKGKPLKDGSTLEGETIEYNEHFSWEWGQGRFGFGYYAGQISRDFRRATLRGVPLPILQVAEYFTFDGEGIRFGRHYRLAGWYCHTLMWCAFGSWIITNILFLVVIRSGSLFLMLTGILQLIAVTIWSCLRNPIEIQVPFQSYDEHGEVMLKTSFGADFKLVLFNGCLCIVLGVILYFLNFFIPDELCELFGIDPLTIYDEYHLSKEELVGSAEKSSLVPAVSVSDIEMGALSSSGDDNLNATQRQALEDVPGNRTTTVFKRRQFVESSLFQRSFRSVSKKSPSQSTSARFSQEQEVSHQPLLTPLSASPYGSSSSREPSFDYGTLPPPPQEFLKRGPPPPPPAKPRNNPFNP